MVNVNKNITGDLFPNLSDSPLEAENAPILDLDTEICAAVKAAIRQSRLSRDQVVDRINLCLRDTDAKLVTKRMLNQWLAPSQEDKRMPAPIIPAICWATRSTLPLETMTKCIQYDLVDAREQVALQYGELAIAQKRIERQRRTLAKHLDGDGSL